MADGAKSGLASGTSGSPQLTLDNAELANKAMENEAAVVGESVFKTPDYKYFDYISRRKDVDPDGKYDIVAHGAPTKVQIDINGKTVLVDARDMARIMSHTAKYQRKQPIRLLSCNTGSITKGFAQNLANKLNTVVYAPTNIVWAYPNGDYIVAPRMSNDPKSPNYNRPNRSKMGTFIPFYPGGKKK